MFKVLVGLIVPILAQPAAADLALTPLPSAATVAATRVVVAQDASATETLRARPTVVEKMIREGICRFTGKTNANEAWLSLVSTDERVAIKVFSAPGANSGTRLSCVEAVVAGLIDAGLAATNITLLDRRLGDLRAAGYPALAEKLGVNLTGSVEAGFDPEAFYENPIPGTLLAGDREFGQTGEGIGRKSYITKAVTRADKIISIVPLLNNNDAGVTGHLFSTGLGLVDNAHRFAGRTDRLLSALPEIYGQPQIFDKVVLNITDALICQYQGESRSLLHYSVPLNQIWFSKDAVALDTLALAELERQRDIANIAKTTVPTQIYANAELLELGVANLRRIRLEMVP
jgi:hypothetical protein